MALQGGIGSAVTLADGLADAAADVEELHGVRIELASAGDLPLDESLEPLVLAAREAMTNAAKFSTSDEISVYLEAERDHVAVFVRDRGAGFDRAAVPADRRGVGVDRAHAPRRRAATVSSSPGWEPSRADTPGRGVIRVVLVDDPRALRAGVRSELAAVEITGERASPTPCR